MAWFGLQMPLSGIVVNPNFWVSGFWGISGFTIEARSILFEGFGIIKAEHCVCEVSTFE